MPQIAINWLLQRPTVSTVIIGARNEEQLRQNLGAVGWALTPDQMAGSTRPARSPPPIRTSPTTSGSLRPAESASGVTASDSMAQGLRDSAPLWPTGDLPHVRGDRQFRRWRSSYNVENWRKPR